MKTGWVKRRGRTAAVAAVLCALVATLAVAASSAAAEEGNSAPIRPISEGGINFREINGPTAPEEYPFQLSPVSPELRLRQVDPQTVVAEYIEGGYEAYTLEAEPAHAADGATVPTTLLLSEGDIVTLTVHHRAGNPAAGGAPFVYPIVGGKGWEGGFFTGRVEMNNPNASPAAPAPTEPAPPTPTCTVPSLHGLLLRAAKARLRADHCSIGDVRLAPGVTATQGDVVKQFRPAGTELAAGAPIAVKLAER